MTVTIGAIRTAALAAEAASEARRCPSFAALPFVTIFAFALLARRIGELIEAELDFGTVERTIPSLAVL